MLTYLHTFMLLGLVDKGMAIGVKTNITINYLQK